MVTVSTRTFFAAAAAAAISAFGTVWVTVCRLASPQTIPPESLELGCLLSLVSFGAFALAALGLVQHGAAISQEIKQGRRGPFSIYRLALPLAITTFVANQMLLSNAFMVGVGFGYWKVVPVAYIVSALAALGALIVSALAAFCSGRRYPQIWRLATMMVVCGLPAWCLGANAATSPFRDVLLAWFQSAAGTH